MLRDMGILHCQASPHLCLVVQDCTNLHKHYHGKPLIMLVAWEIGKPGRTISVPLFSCDINTQDCKIVPNRGGNEKSCWTRSIIPSPGAQELQFNPNRGLLKKLGLTPNLAILHMAYHYSRLNHWAKWAIASLCWITRGLTIHHHHHHHHHHHSFSFTAPLRRACAGGPNCPQGDVFSSPCLEGCVAAMGNQCSGSAHDTQMQGGTRGGPEWFCSTLGWWSRTMIQPAKWGMCTMKYKEYEF